MSKEKSGIRGYERREIFRVNDVFPVKIRRVNKETAKRSVIHSVTGSDIPDIASDETINPSLWKMLVNIAVNISATGIRFTEDERIETGDEFELTMLLPTTPPVKIMTYGTAVRVDVAGNSKYEVALRFTDMDDAVRDEILQYLLNHQRAITRFRKATQ